MNMVASELLTLENSEILLRRQPILNGNSKIVAYELLFRSGKVAGEDFDDLMATSTVIVNTLSHFGFDHVLGTTDAYIKVSASLIMSELIEILPCERVVLEILQDVPIGPQILVRCKALKEMGFRLALDHYSPRADYTELLPLIDVIKLDVPSNSYESLMSMIKEIRLRSRALLLAQQVEFEDEFSTCKQLGFELFQGYFFARPTIIKGKKPQPNQVTLMRIMGMLIGDGDIHKLELVFKENPDLMVSLLRLVNSVGVSGGGQKISTVRQALIMIGQKQLLRWVQLLMYVNNPSPAASSLMKEVANRSRLMELVSTKLGASNPNISDQAFMVGMLSMADVVLQVPLEEVVAQIGLVDSLKQALLAREGLLGKLLDLTEQIESGNFDHARSEMEALGLSPKVFTTLQLEAMRWAHELSQQAAG